MKNLVLAIVVANVVLVAACGQNKNRPQASRPVDSDKLAALDTAYKAGVLSKEEYEAKKRELAQPAAPAAPPSKADPAQLSAIETAYQAGVLTKEEYEARKRELMAGSSPAPAASPMAAAGGWARQRDPHGFEIEHPAGWTVEATSDMRIVVRSQDGGSLVAIAPFVRGGTTCQQYLQQSLGSSAVFPHAQVTNVTQRRQQPDEAVAAFTFQGGRSRGAAMCSLYRGSGMTFAIAAPAALYDRQKEDLVRIVRSLSFAQSQGNGGPAAPARPRVQYTRFTDPREGSFFVDIPAGWRTEGGLLRRSAIDITASVRTMSPDGETAVFLNDEQLMHCITPNSFGGMTAIPEGGIYDSGAGTRLMVLRYQPPQMFAMNYLGQIQRRYGVSGIQVKDRRERPDLAEPANRQAAQYNANPLGAARYANSEVSFVGQRNGRPVAGYLLVAIEATPWMNNGTYWTPTVMGFVAPMDQGRQAQEILWHSAFSAQANPQWVAMQQKTTMATSHIFVQSSHAVDDIITKSYWSTQATNDRIFQSDSDARRDQVRLRDPQTGEEFTAAAGHNYYYRPAAGDERHIFGTDDTDRPNIDATELLIVK